MGLLKLLEEKATQYHGTNEQEKNVLTWLNYKARDIITTSSKHLKYVSHVFKEFDIHDAEHSEGVLNIIENLLGDKAQDLSSYELFFLIAVSYLHDCGMAVSDYEMVVLNMAEKKLDVQTLVKPEEANRMIRKNLRKIYGSKCNSFDDGEIQHWLFVPAKEETLINYLVELLIDYQSFRNGKIDKINASKGKAKINTNNELRVEYLRITHHKRIEKYVKNWCETRFADFPDSDMGSCIANDIAKCCRAHGEDSAFIDKEFENDTEVEYRGPDNSCNLQFVAMMLRLGDIIHFSNDRAHPVLRSLHHFKSEYSYQQWRIKANGLVFNVSNGKVSCSANCKVPKDYYDLMDYVDCIDRELLLFNALSHKWKRLSNIKFDEKVNRNNIRHDASFNPVRGLKFTLDQNKVLDLLMGANLYTNKYACLRELYQNSLDACRCQIAKDKAADRISTGYIEFGLGEEKGRKFVYCLDNGKGMTKEIIEKYLLHIGSSYYKSTEFFQKQAETGATFTPTSQFGIGMLSCFLIGDVIEITTHEEGSEDGIISCVMEGPNENFYYKTPTLEEANKLKYKGTLVKVFLNQEYKNLLNDDPLEKLGYLIWYKYKRYYYNCNFREIVKHGFDRWNHHIYHIMNDFIVVVPKDIKVQISLQNLKGVKKPVEIYNKPLPISGELMDYANINPDVHLKSWFEWFKERVDLIIHIQDEKSGLECKTLINMGDDGTRMIETSCDEGVLCVDGIAVNNVSKSDSICYKLVHNAHCVLNFYGNQRPQLSVDRDSLMYEDLNEFDEAAGSLLSKLIDKSISEIWKYIIDNGFEDDRTFNKIMTDLSDRFEFCEDIFYEHLHNTELYNSELYKKAMFGFLNDNNDDDTNDPDIRDEEDEEDEEIDPGADDF